MILREGKCKILKKKKKKMIAKNKIRFKLITDIDHFGFNVTLVLAKR